MTQALPRFGLVALEPVPFVASSPAAAIAHSGCIAIFISL